MSWKGFFKKLLQGTDIVLNFASIILMGVPLKPRTSLIITTLINAIHFAEENWPESASGIEKFKFVMSLSLTSLEAASGKNVNNPKTRAILEKCVNLYVQIMNLIAQLKVTIKELDEAIEASKEPAIDDAPAPTE